MWLFQMAFDVTVLALIVRIAFAVKSIESRYFEKQEELIRHILDQNKLLDGLKK